MLANTKQFNDLKKTNINDSKEDEYTKEKAENV